jgi:uncharacterized protein (TIGR02145 family)
MSIKCNLGFHDWTTDCEKCSKCRKARENQHDWSKDCEKCSKCGKTRESQHNWINDCEKCSLCHKTRQNYHDWSKDACKCSKCIKEQHSFVNFKCTKCNKELLEGTFTDDRDGHIYKWIRIGSQIIMAENLAYKTNIGCWSYNNVQSNVNTYGYLYDWATAKKVAPAGWHLPSKEEWKTLYTYLGDYDRIVFPRIRDSGFNALLGGERYDDGKYYFEGKYSHYWSSTEVDASFAWCLCISAPKSEVSLSGSGIRRFGYSVRLFKDN